MSMSRLYIMIFALLLAVLDAAAATGQVQAWLDRTRIEEGETVQLTLEVPGQVNDRPDTSPLERDFDILGLSTGSRMSFVNGRSDSRTSWTLTLSPKHGGTLTVPALRVGGYTSAALTLEVGKAPAPVAGNGADIFVETDISPRQPFVQQQVIYTVRLLHAVPVSSGQLSEPKPANTLVERLGDDREYAVTRNGRHYQVVERRYALFPQGSGRLELDAPVFDGEVPDSSGGRTSPLQRFFGNDPFFGRGLFNDLVTPRRRVRVRGEAAELDVRPRAADAQGVHWLPAQSLTLRGSWQPDGARVSAGEPVTLVLDIDAKGLTGGQLPDLAPQTVDGFSVYPDQAQRSTDPGDSGVTGHLHQKIAFIPRRPGDLGLPAITVNWWDTEAGQERTASLSGRVLHVLPASGQAAPPASAATPALPAPPAQTQPAVTDIPAAAAAATESRPVHTALSGAWPWASALLAAGWLLTLLLWWWRARGARPAARAPAQSTAPGATARAARKQFLAACQSGDAVAARRSLIDWAGAHWPHDPPRGLDELGRRLNDPQAREALTELDRALYKGSADWDGRQLAARLQQLPQPVRRGASKRESLAPLYPASGRSYG